MRKRLQRNKFTLVELLVALGVFSLLLIVFMQMFSGMRLVWTNTEQRNDAHVQARAAMDVLTTLFSSTFYSTAGDEGFFPIRFTKLETDIEKTNKAYFASKTRIELPGTHDIRYVSPQLITAESDYRDKLLLLVFYNGDSEFYKYFPEYDFTAADLGSNTVTDKLVTKIDNKVDNGKVPTSNLFTKGCFIELANCVTGFRITAYDRSGNTIMNKDNDSDALPHSVEIRLAVLNKNDYETYVQQGRNADFRRSKETVFTRRIYLGERVNTGGGL